MGRGQWSTKPYEADAVYFAHGGRIAVIGSDLIPRRHVPGHGPLDAEIVLIGEAPGAQENYTGIPFIGPAGKELSRYLRSAGLSREQIYITNLSKFWPDQSPQGKQLPPSREAVIRDEPELLMELDMIRPRIIGAVGAHAARWLLQHRFNELFRSEHNRKITLFRDHGIPHTISADDPVGRVEDPKYLGFDAVVIPLTHPSAGLHASNQQIAIQWDFQQLGLLYRNRIPAHPPVNEHPEPTYMELTDALGGAEIIRDVLAGRTEIAIDTEGGFEAPECLTFCVEPGEAFLVTPTERECLAAIDEHINAYRGICTVIFHYAGHDIPVVEIDEKLRRLNALGVRVNKYRAVNDDGSLSIRCTMSEAYLLGGIHPKGLKPLSWRISGGEMDAYEDVVGPTEEQRSHGYLEQVFEGLQCGTCFGTGKSAKKYDVVDAECGDCGGGGRVAGKRAGTTKKCACVKQADKCLAEGCNDGLVVPMPDREFIFDADKQDFRWKQPQSMGKWVKRRLEKSYDAESLQAALGGEESAEEDLGEDEQPDSYFKLRYDWRDLEDRNDKLYVEGRLGPMPRTRLFDVPDRQRVINYACADADYTLRNSRKLPSMLAERNLTTIQRIDAAVIPMISRMEQVGMMIDREDCERFSGELDKEMAQLRDKLSSIVGAKTNPNSPKVADILFRQLGLPIIKLTKSKARESIDDDTLGALKASLRKRSDVEDPFSETAIALAVMDCVTDYRERQKLLTTYCRPLLQKMDRNGRVHTTLNYSTVVTGRLSSEDPNLQNCFSGDTEVLTEQGWMRFDRLIGLRVAQWSPLSGIEFVHPTGYVYYGGREAIRISNQHIDLAVTSDHRCLLRHRKAGSLRVFPASQYPEDWQQLNAGVYGGGRGEPVPDAWIRLAVAFQADGSWVLNGGLDFSFKKRRKVSRLIGLIESAGLDYSIKESERVRIYVRKNASNSEFLHWLRLTLGDHKIFPHSWFMVLDRGQIDSVLDEVMWWDGCATRGNHYASKLKENADLIQILYSLSGVRAVVRRYENSDGAVSWQVDITGRDYSMTTNKSVEGLGRMGVYCLSVPSTYLMVRRNGKVMITGNCPNPDNSPIYGRRLRNLFIARPGYKLISADYSQIEMVVGAHLTQDAGMLEVFRKGLDLHRYAASMMFGIPYDQVKNPSALRTQVKPLNFGCFYGLSAMGLQAQFASLPSGAVEKSEAECQELIDRYYAAFPGVLEWKKRLWQNARATGYVETMFGRKRLVPGLRSDIDKVRAAAEREAGNQPIQGTAQDILKIGMAGVWENVLPLVWDDGLDIEPINQVHDELLFECEEGRVGEVLPLIESELKYAVKLSVPIKVGISVADRWGGLK